VIVIVVALYPRMIIKYVRANYFPDDSDIYREIEKYHMVDGESLENLYDLTDELDQKVTVNTGVHYAVGTSVGNEEDARFNTGHSEGLSVPIDASGSVKKSSNSIYYSTSKYSSYKSPRLGTELDEIYENEKSNTYSGAGVTYADAIKRYKIEPGYSTSNQNVTNLDQLMQNEDIDGMESAYGLEKRRSSIVQSESSVYTSGKLISISGVSDDDDFSTATSIHPTIPLTPLNTPSVIFPTSCMTLDRKHKAMSIRSARSRRNNILKQGTSADGQAMSVIFMDNNEEYVNTGFAFSFNDENEMQRRSRRNNPLFKAKSVDEIYERRRKRRHKMQRKLSTSVARRPDPSDSHFFK